MRRKFDDKRGTAISLNNLGAVARYRGDYAEATRLLDESMRLRQTIGARTGIATGLGTLADIARCQGEHARAKDLYRQSIRLRQQLRINEGLAECLLGLADLARADGQSLQAARLLGTSDALRESMHLTVPPVDRPSYERTVAAIQASLAPEAFAAARVAGHALTTEQAITEALNDVNDDPVIPTQEGSRDS